MGLRPVGTTVKGEPTICSTLGKSLYEGTISWGWDLDDQASTMVAAPASSLYSSLMDTTWLAISDEAVGTTKVEGPLSAAELLNASISSTSSTQSLMPSSTVRVKSYTSENAGRIYPVQRTDT